MIVQALIMAFGIPYLLQQNGIPFKWPELIIPAMIVCGLNSAAYMAEVIRGGIQAVDPGQVEAAQSLGMSKGQINRLIVLPQAFRIVIPSFGNEFITLIKETAVLSYVGIVEILRIIAGSALECGSSGHIPGVYRSRRGLSGSHFPSLKRRGSS